jgi:hypothetical protein
MSKAILKKLIQEEVRKALNEDTQTSVMRSHPGMVEEIIEMLKHIDVDGETMEYILDKVGMTEQMQHQLTPGGIR